MKHRLYVLAAGLVIGFAGLVTGVALTRLLPGLMQLPAALGAGAPGPQAAKSADGPDRNPAAPAPDQQGLLQLTPEAIEEAGIKVAAVGGGVIARRLIVPGAIAPHADRIAHVSVKLPGIVAELRKNIGDAVEKNEVLAVLESRDVADAKSEYLATRLANELQQDLFQRDQALWDKRISSEQQFIRSRNDAARTKMQNDIARQKLFALGLTEAEIAGLPSQPESTLRRQEIRSPIAGRVAERKVELGVVVGRDNLETELFVVADLDRVWAELAVGPEDARLVRIGQPASIAARAGGETVEGRVVFIAPILDKNTRTARAVAEIDNGNGVWRPGLFVTAAIAFEQRAVPVAIPPGAIQTMDGGPVVFVRTSGGFQKRHAVVGESDERAAEVVSGLKAGETIAVTNTFLLKAEMLKETAED